MANETYSLISRITIDRASAAQIAAFTNIPQGYTDLKIVMHSRQTLAQSYGVIALQLNQASNNEYDYLVATRYFGSGAQSSTQVAVNAIYGVYSDTGGNATANSFSANEFYIQNYSATDKFKNVVFNGGNGYNNQTDTYLALGFGTYKSTSAITHIQLTTGGSGAYFEPFTEFSLYGIANSFAIPATMYSPSAVGGTMITKDSTYWYHAFQSSGTFIPKKDLTVDLLILGGGGGGAGGTSASDATGAGGGAGGIRNLTSQRLLKDTQYSVVVGAGGAGGAAGTNDGNNGGYSLMLGCFAAGGGGAGAVESNGRPGGCGSGSGATGNARVGGIGFVDGFNGGNGGSNTGGGGGGLGSSGTNGGGGTGQGGSGGAGINTYHSGYTQGALLGVNNFIGGGGGGGARDNTGGGPAGSGGGGTGGNATTGVLPTTAARNSGSGGAGGGGRIGYTQQAGSNGGSGFVIVRYRV